MPMQFFERIHVLPIGISIGGGLMNGVVGYNTFFGRNLSIKGRFKLSVSHVVFLHAYKGGIGVGFAHGVSISQLFVLVFVLFYFVWPVFLNVFDFIFEFGINIYITQGLVYLFY
jgi:hypothetical protein